jgi:hypothetical protein
MPHGSRSQALFHFFRNTKSYIFEGKGELERMANMRGFSAR